MHSLMSENTQAETKILDDAVRKEQVARWSVFASVVLTVGKLLAGLFSGSLALLSEAAHAAVDTVATSITWFAVRTSNKPADEEHHYGHGKFESVAALVETAILFLLTLAVIYHAIQRLLSGGGNVETSALVFAVIIISIIIDINRIYALHKVAHATGSHALAADVLHFSSDLAGSVMVLLGLIASAYGFRYGDALAAIGVAVFIGIAGYRLGKRTLNTLLDTAPSGRTELICELVSDIPGVVEITSLRLRPGGNEIFGEIIVNVPRTLPLDRVAAIKKRINDVVRSQFPDTVLTVTANPCVVETETVLERIMLIAVKRRIPVHHVTVQNIEGRLSVSFDMEVNGRMILGAAHTLASGFEKAIRDEFGPETEVDTHIEPLELDHLSGNDADESITKAIESSLVSCASENAIVSEIHNVRVRQTNNGLIVNYHCRVDPELDVTTVHNNVDAVERCIRGKHPEILRVVGHTDILK